MNFKNIFLYFFLYFFQFQQQLQQKNQSRIRGGQSLISKVTPLQIEGQFTQYLVYIDQGEMESQFPIRPKGNYLSQCKTVNLTSNLYKVTFSQQTQIRIYSIKSNPIISYDSRVKFNSLLQSAYGSISKSIGNYIVSGRTLYGCQKPIFQGQLTIQTILQDQKYVIIIKQVKMVSMSNIFSDDKKNSGLPFNFMNSMIKNFFKQLGYIEIGKSKKYFDPKNRCNLNNSGVILFNGFSTSFNLLEKGLFLRVDSSTRIVQNQSVLELIDRIYSENSQKERDQKRTLIKQQFVNRMVMTNYGNSKYYVVQDILFDTSLQTYTLNHQGNIINLIQYYKNRYNINIKKKKQPLIKATLQSQNKNQIILVPELLLISGLPQNFDQRKRREISDYTILKPSVKFSQIQQLRKNFNLQQGDFSPRKVAQNLNITLQELPTKVKGKQLANPILDLGKGNKVQDNKVANFMLFNKPLNSTVIPLKIGIICPTDFNLSEIKGILESTCKNLSVKYSISHFNIHFNDAKGSLRRIEQIIHQQWGKRSFNLFWFIIPPQWKNNYKLVKRMTLNQQIQVNTQFTLTSTLNKKGFNSICTKILLQMAAKVGNILWIPRISSIFRQNKLMIVGIDLASDKNNRKKSVVAYCSSVNTEMSEFYSGYDYQQQGLTVSVKTRKILSQCLNQYIKKNRTPPQQVVILKNGNTTDQVSLLQASQIKDARQAINLLPQSTSKPNLTYINVDKNVSQKFFLERNCQANNPCYGTLVNTEVVSNHYDFYLISQNCNRGTAKPAYYKVLYCDSKVEQGILEELIYVQCFNYMNWTGSVKVPGVLQYAKKLSMFASQYINSELECNQIKTNLFYI